MELSLRAMDLSSPFDFAAAQVLPSSRLHAALILRSYGGWH